MCKKRGQSRRDSYLNGQKGDVYPGGRMNGDNLERIVAEQTILAAIWAVEVECAYFFHFFLLRY